MALLGSTIPFLTLVFLVFTLSTQAREILIGGEENAWKIPQSGDDTLNHWAEKNRFKIGDYLVWKYDEKVDSVMEVTRDGYNKCNKSNPLSSHKDGNTKVKLYRSGLFYFISGADDHCLKGQKIIVVVLSDHHGRGRRTAREFLIGGNENAWKIPESANDSLNLWARRNRFKVGDFLVWHYDEKTDSVVEVTSEGYDACDVSNPISSHNDGNTKVKLYRSGLFYFISGAYDHCVRGQKLIVAVLSEKHGHGSDHLPGGPSDTEDPTTSPAPAPARNKGDKSSAHAVMGDGYLGSLVIGFGLVLSMSLDLVGF